MPDVMDQARQQQLIVAVNNINQTLMMVIQELGKLRQVHEDLLRFVQDDALSRR